MSTQRGKMQESLRINSLACFKDYEPEHFACMSCVMNSCYKSGAQN